MNRARCLKAGILTGALLGGSLPGSALNTFSIVISPPAVDLTAPDFSNACDPAASTCGKPRLPRHADDAFGAAQQFAPLQAEAVQDKQHFVLLAHADAGASDGSGIVTIGFDTTAHQSDDGRPSGDADSAGNGNAIGTGLGANANVGIVVGDGNSDQRLRPLVAIANMPGFVPAGTGTPPFAPPPIVRPSVALPGKAPTPANAAPGNTVSAALPAETKESKAAPGRTPKHNRKHTRRPLIPSLLPDFVPHFDRIPPPIAQDSFAITQSDLATAASSVGPSLVAHQSFSLVAELLPTGDADPALPLNTSQAVLQAIPEPPTIALLALVLAGFGSFGGLGIGRRK